MISRRFLYPVILILLWTSIFISSINRPGLLDDVDSIHAEAAKEMAQSGDWVTLRINNGIRYLEKAPFMYWMTALSIRVFGVHDWAVRLPSALFSLFFILLLLRFGTRLWGPKTGLYSGIVIATCLGHYAFTRLFLPDGVLSFFITLFVYMYFQIAIEEDEPKRAGPVDLRCAVLYISVALAVLTKGLIGLIFPVVIVFFHILLSGNWKIINKLQIPYGIIIFLAVAAPWHIAAALANSDFLWFYFIREHMMRYLGTRYPKDSGSVPPILFLALLLVWLFPWSAFIWEAIRKFPKSIRSRDRTQQAYLLLFIWIGAVLIFFSLGKNQEYYTFPCLGAFALLIGKVVADLDEREAALKSSLTGLGIMTALGILIGAGMIWITWTGDHAMQNYTLAETLTDNPDCYYVHYGHLCDLTQSTFSHLAPLVYRAAVLLIAGPAIALFFALRGRFRSCIFVLAVLMIAVCHTYADGLVAFESVIGSKGLSEVVKQNCRGGDKIVINDRYEEGSTLNYYTGRQVYVMKGQAGVLWYGLMDKSAPKLWLGDDELLNAWAAGERIFLFTSTRNLQAFQSRHPDFIYRVLAHEGGKEVLVNW